MRGVVFDRIKLKIYYTGVTTKKTLVQICLCRGLFLFGELMIMIIEKSQIGILIF
jgi:hypothetical protein